MKSILVFSHEHNTFDKRKLLENPHPQFLEESTKTIDMFIKNEKESKIKDFFVNQIDKLLAKYEPGEPKMKPDVLKQIKEIDEERRRMQDPSGKSQHQLQNENGIPQIMVERPNEPPKALTPQEIVELLQQQQQAIQQLNQQVIDLQTANADLQKQLAEKPNVQIREVKMIDI